MVLNGKGQVTIPAQLRAKYGLHTGDEVQVVDVDGVLQIVRTGSRTTPLRVTPERSGPPR
jgi:AbrB family looped-hinge helix DNA binding protein